MSLEALIARVLGATPQDVRPDIPLRDIPGWDSMRHVELVGALEEAYSVRFTIAEVVSMASPAAIRAILARKRISA